MKIDVRGFDDILADMTGRLPDSADTREGSLFYDALAPFAYELSKVYAMLDDAYTELFADKADRVNLLKLCRERSIIPKPASCAVYSAVAVMDDGFSIPPETVFSVGGVRLSVTAHDGGENYTLTAVSPGADGNRAPLDVFLTPDEYISGFCTLKLTLLTVSGTDDESTDDLRVRYFESIGSLAFGGNVEDYVRNTLRLSGVGAVKVVPCFDGGGTVKLILLDGQFNPPSDSLISYVSAYYDSEDGMAPVGHSVTVCPASPFPVSVSAGLVLAAGVSSDVVCGGVSSAVSDYFAGLRAAWGRGDPCGGAVTVRVSHVLSRILDVPGVVDVPSLFLNESFANIVLPLDNVPVLGECGYDF
ncbi:baseplate assembly protein [Clostridia bacterium]|nr:baseplate assembly protein [Clostridia bacterium]